jgi:hypothetical protein
MDQSKKTMRHFYCRDVLWETFEQMANDFDCSIDYLVNEAMRYYARSKNYQSPGGPQMTQGAPVAPNPNTTSGPTAFPGGPGKPTPGGNGMRGQPGTQPPPQPAPGAGGGRRAQPPTPGYQGPNNNANARAPGQPGGGAGGGGGAMVGLQHSGAPSTGHSPAPISTMGASGPTLFLIYNGQRYPVTKDQFIIGRGSKTSDLPIKDGNISRKHAAVIRRNGTFYIKDLGSTNGIDYKGMRIDNKRIDEGDVFHLCDYELRFTYRAD